MNRILTPGGLAKPAPTDRAMCRIALFLLTLLLGAVRAADEGTAPAARSSPAEAVFQYAVRVQTKQGPKEGYLWIPPQAEQVRGVLVAGMTLAERELVRDPQVRAACGEEALAVLFVKSGIGSFDVQQALDAAAEESGYRELAVAPLFFVGHSAGGPQALAAATKHQERCFGLMQYRGGHPGVGRSGGEVPLPAGIPALMMLGQFDEFGKVHRDEQGRENWENGVDSLAAYNALADDNLGSLVVEPGAGHFAWSDRCAAYFALFLRKAAKARIPDWPVDAAAPVRCREVAATSGWRTDLRLAAPKHPAAPAEKFVGERGRSSWHFDQEMAEATIAIHRGLAGKRDQFLRWQDKHTVQAGARNFLSEIRWIGDGQTLEVRPDYAVIYPRQQKDGSGPRWATAGEPVGRSKAPIHVRTVGGPLATSGKHALRVRFDALSPATAEERAVFLASSAGDDNYRHTELVGMLPPGFARLKEGKPQTISFPAIGNLASDAAPIGLRAVSDAGLPVEYYVACGPAMIDNGKLKIAELPRRAKFPIAVRIVAYQFGRAIEPRVASATPVEQTIHIESARR